MKKIIFLITILLFASSTLFGGADEMPSTRSGGNLSTVKNALLRFESNVRWSAVSSSWRRIRRSWIGNVKRAYSANRLGSLLARFESNIKWSAVSTSWRGIRSGWKSRARRCNSASQVARLLLKLESNTKWSAVSSSWRGIRSGWIRSLRSVR